MHGKIAKSEKVSTQFRTGGKIAIRDLLDLQMSLDIL